MEKSYHLNIHKKQLHGAKIALLPGDPFRVNKIAATIDKDFQELAFHREYKSALAALDGIPILVVSTGIGGPSTAIAVEELACLGVESFIRLGTSGSIQPFVKIGDMVITNGAVRLEGTSSHYAPIEYPAVADFQIVKALVNSAEKNQFPYHVGISAASDTFYPGQERYNTFSQYVIKKFQGSMEEWKKLRVLNFEMESASLLTICSVFGLKAGAVCGIIAQRTEEEQVNTDIIPTVEKNLGKIVKEAIRELNS